MKRELIAAACCLALAACSRTKPEAASGKEAGETSNLVTVEEAAQKNVGVEVAPVRRTLLAERLQTTGTVQPVDSLVSQVRAPARGRLQQVLARVGDRVQAGGELARLENLEAGELTAQLASARAELQRLKVLLAAQSRQVERNRKLAAIGAAPAKDLEQSRAEFEALEESIRSQESAVAGVAARLKRFGASESVPGAPVITSITAPLGGIVIKAPASPGEVVETGAPLFTVADLSRVWVQAEVYEKDLGRIQLGQSAIIRVDAYPERLFSGAVSYIGDTLDPQTRTAKVRCEVPNGDVRLKLDMYATIQLPTTFSRQALAAPEGAIQQLGGKAVVFVQLGATRFEARQIEPGKTVDGLVEILSGLREGEKIVIAGAYHLKSIVAGKELGEE